MQELKTDILIAGAGLGGVAGALAALVLPFAFASTSLTTFSLGSCDAADYSAGARVLQEFARGDRAGYLGLVEVVRVHSVDNFFDYWLRLNHFTPSALIAFHASIFALAPHEPRQCHGQARPDPRRRRHPGRQGEGARGRSGPPCRDREEARGPVSYTHLRAHETVLDLPCRLLLEKKQ
mgnify:CR=1 FL=1